MGGEEDVVPGAHAEMNLPVVTICGISRKSVLPPSSFLHAADFERIMSGRVGILYGILGRAIRGAVAVVPALREAGGGIGVLHRLVETEQHAVVASSNATGTGLSPPVKRTR